MGTNIIPIVMAEECWANSQLSVARYYGGIKIQGREYKIVNKDGKDLFECSVIAEKEGRTMAIEPGEPADLCRVDFIPIYKRLGREKMLQFLKDNPMLQTAKEAEKILKQQSSETHKD